MTTLQAISTDPIAGTYWKWRDQLIYYVHAGECHPERPPLLLVHGFGASTDHWRKNIQDLQQDFDVWAIDLVGFGRSAKPDWEYSGQLWRDQLHDFITEVIGQPAVVAGNSLGGYAVLSVAAHYPEATKGVILLNSAGPFTDTKPRPEPPIWKKALSQVMRSLFRQEWVSFLIFQWTKRRSTIRKTLLKVYLDPSAVTDQLVEEIYRPSCDPGASKVFASVFKSPQGDKVDVLLQQLTRPLLLIWGEGDPWMNSRERSVKFHEHYPNLTEYFLKAGHCPHDEVPDQVDNIIRSWVSSI